MSRATTKIYSYNGLSGCVQQSISRETGKLVGVYHGGQAGFVEESIEDDDTETPWYTVCEGHGTMIASKTLALAKASCSSPSSWCEDCRKALST